MKTTITGKNMNVTQPITDRIMKKTNKMARYLTPEAELNVRLSKEKNGRRAAELTIINDTVILRSEAYTDDNLYLAIDLALAKLEKQIHKHRNKLEKRLKSDAFSDLQLEYIEEVEFAAPAEERKIVKNKTFPVRPMSLEDAIMQMELLGHSFFVFINLDTDRTNVLYLRKDGDLGLLEPEQ